MYRLARHVRIETEQSVLIYDRRLVRVSPALRRFVARFPHRYAVTAGEKLKDLRHFAQHMVALGLVSEALSPRELQFVSLGGGSVGDFAGFAASVFKRGVGLVHVPTTWLAAMDSAHGGKTALNVGGVKNQIGTFFPASQVILVQEFLLSQKRAQVQDAWGEMAKIALLDGSGWGRRLVKVMKGHARQQAIARSVHDDVLEKSLWRNLRSAISAKLRIVARDPQEKLGRRQVLNLGHTFGHVLEALTGLSHGQAVALGLDFSLRWSARRTYLKAAACAEARSFLHRSLALDAFAKADAGILKKHLKAADLRRCLRRDKKGAGRDRLNFVFWQGWGRPLRRLVDVADVVQEARRQGWL